MASSSENFLPNDPWTHRPPFSDSWISQSLNIDNQVLISNHPQTVSSVERPELTGLKRPNSVIIGKKKKKMHKSKGDTTTLIMTDLANFREMVQQVTGERFAGNWPAAAPLKPEPQRMVNHGFMQQGYLPTLDTSTFLLKSTKYHRLEEGDQITVSPPSATVATAGLSCFPTLESCSWKVL
ncbi:calmodulin-binding protein 25-like [Impatiens glandulifera]|uniref:calmodulin-binding protein 25-like n=1 Tax=Impatiens glandulifera TaxID=253017 RepID=UPI001FB18000|nr:calmodulin-binding protein 25-like [Impatiens glandulifera]